MGAEMLSSQKLITKKLKKSPEVTVSWFGQTEILAVDKFSSIIWATCAPLCVGKTRRDRWRGGPLTKRMENRSLEVSAETGELDG